MQVFVKIKNLTFKISMVYDGHRFHLVHWRLLQKRFLEKKEVI
jgi:hypothetical protein